MVKSDKIEVDGTVVEILGGGYYKIDLGNGMFVRAKPAGKLRKHNIKIIVGDKVKVELNEYDPTQGRITYRLSGKRIVEDK